MLVRCTIYEIRISSFCHFGVNQPFCCVHTHLHNLEEGLSCSTLFCYRVGFTNGRQNSNNHLVFQKYFHCTVTPVCMIEAFLACLSYLRITAYFLVVRNKPTPTYLPTYAKPFRVKA